MATNQTLYSREQLDFRLYTAVMGKQSPDSLIKDEEIMSFTRQDDLDEQGLLKSLLFSSIDYAEQYMGRLIGEATVKGEFKNYYDELYLPYDPKEIISLKGEDYNGALQDVPFTFSPVRSSIKITNTDYLNYSNFSIEYKAGWQLNEVPHSVLFGIKRLVATMYESRQEEIYGVSASSSAIKTNRFFDLYRLRGS